MQPIDAQPEVCDRIAVHIALNECAATDLLVAQFTRREAEGSRADEDECIVNPILQDVRVDKLERDDIPPCLPEIVNAVRSGWCGHTEGSFVEDEAIGAATSPQLVLSRSTGNRVVAIAAIDGVVPRTAPKNVGALRAGETVRAIVALEKIGPVASDKRVVAQPACQPIVAGEAG